MATSPVIIPACTSHSRLFPKFHSFAYPYLLVGIPVVPGGLSGPIITLDEKTWWKRSWLSVLPEDHLGRGNNANGLYAKFNDYLRSEGVDASSYAHIYLVTAPRFLAHKFAPASFWFLYSQGYKLEAMVVEVNNTFDERQMYFLPHSMEKASKEIVSEHNQEDEQLVQRSFRQKFDKVFHVSPFSSRKGGYSIMAQDPLASVKENGDVVVNIMVTLRSSKGHGKVVARLYSKSRSLDPSSMSLIHKMSFLSLWSLTGWMTFPRILYEAYKLYRRRGLSIWLRPEVNPSSTGRSWTKEEICLERVFRQYLEAKVQDFPESLALEYVSAQQLDDNFQRIEIFRSRNHLESSADERPTSRMQIVTPAFYSRFACYLDGETALTTEALDPTLENRTARFNDDQVGHLLARSWTSENQRICGPVQTPATNRLGWALLGFLRQNPAKGSYPRDSVLNQKDAKIISQTKDQSSASKRFSDLDIFVINHFSVPEQKQYRRIVSRVLLSERLCFGNVILLKLLIFAVNCILVCCMEMLVGKLHAMDAVSSGFSTAFRLGLFFTATVWIERHLI